MSYQLPVTSHQPNRALRVTAAVVAIALAPALSVSGSPYSGAALQAQETGLALGTKAPSSTMVTTLDGKPFAGGAPGPVFRRMHATFQQHKPKAARAA